MPRKLTLERTVTERATLEHDDTTPIAWAPGWDQVPTERHLYLAQRAGQVERCADFLALWDASAAPGTEVPERLIAEAAIILRAGPGASPLELCLGRIA